MYHQINPTETFRERQLALRHEAENRRLARRLPAGRGPKARSTIAAVLGLVVALVAGLLAANNPAYASTTFTVNSATDFAEDLNLGDGVCDVTASTENTCTLRAAIQEANATDGADTISFNIPGTGVKTISPNTNFPNIIDPVSIDGFTQPSASPNTLAKGTNAKLMIELNGSNVTGTFDRIGLRLSAPNSEVKGLVINRFTSGVAIFGEGALLRQNFIGTDPTGTQDLGNSGSGIFNQGIGAAIGTPSPQEANLISGNNGAGILIRDLASNTQVSRNLIGTDKSGTKNLGNAKEGVEISNSSNNFLENNTIAFNGGDGVSIEGGGPRSGIIVSSNTIFSNWIFSNGGLGINLIDPNALIPVGSSEGATPNDPGDLDSGPNGLQNKPVISSAKTVSGKTTIQCKLNSTPSQTYTIQLFSNPSGNEGKKFIGQKSVTTDGSGNRSFTFSPANAVAVGRTITATATRVSTLDTSEFSAPRRVASS
jgi:parallel beta-helix repeat protein